MFSFFKKSKKKEEEEELLAYAPKDFSFLKCDMHSHLIPGIDDGSASLEESLDLIRSFQAKGYTKLITTPHVQLEFYDNKREKITDQFAKLKDFISQQIPGMTLEAAAEYYLDNLFISSILEEGLLTFGKNYVLVEVSMAGWPRNFSDAIFAIQSAGYTPVLAHPERYLYEENPDTYKALKAKGLMMQMNLLSPLGYYGRSVKNLAEKYMDAGIYDLCGSDVHGERHMNAMEKLAAENPAIMMRLANYAFQNDTLLG